MYTHVTSFGAFRCNDHLTWHSPTFDASRPSTVGRRPSASKGEAFPGKRNGSGMGFTWIYPLVMTNIAVENGWTWPFIVDVPIENMVILKTSLVITDMTNSLLWKMASLSRIFPRRTDCSSGMSWMNNHFQNVLIHFQFHSRIYDPVYRSYTCHTNVYKRLIAYIYIYKMVIKTYCIYLHHPFCTCSGQFGPNKQL